MIQRIRWNGTADEGLASLQALRAHCECRVDAGRTLAPWAAHTMMAFDQRAIDGLVFMRRIAPRLLGEEFDLLIPSP